MRLMIWRGLADGAETAPDETPARQDLASMRRRQADGELAAALDPGCVLLALMGMVSAPISMPHMARKILGLEPRTAEFEALYSGQLRQILSRLADPTQDEHEQTGDEDASNE